MNLLANRECFGSEHKKLLQLKTYIKKEQYVKNIKMYENFGIGFFKPLAYSGDCETPPKRTVYFGGF
jgi:hypothetical protein